MFAPLSCRRIAPLLLAFITFAILNIVFTPRVQAALVDINSANSEELQTLVGIGPAKAQAIIDYRNQNGLFKSLEEIKNVSGIGDATYANIKDFITISSAAPIGDTAVSEANIRETTTDKSTTITKRDSAAPLSIGKDRVVTVGVRVEFRAEGVQASREQKMYSWNFGDGFVSSGVVVSHVYEYPGDYVVVLSVPSSQAEVISKINVKVIEPELVVSYASSERIEITNKSSYEIDLFGYALVAHKKVFIFPRNSMIKPGQKISFSKRITALMPNSPEEVRLISLGEEISEWSALKRLGEIEKERVRKIVEIKKQISELELKKSTVAKVTQSNNYGNNKTDKKTEEVSEISEEGSSTEEFLSSPNYSRSWWTVLKEFLFRTK